MTPAEHRARAEYLLERNDAVSVEKAQVHATLALTPPPPTTQPTQHKWSLDQPHHVPDATGGQVTVFPVRGAPGVILSVGEDAALLENPDILRTLASLLTAHADRLESKP